MGKCFSDRLNAFFIDTNTVNKLQKRADSRERFFYNSRQSRIGLEITIDLHDVVKKACKRTFTRGIDPGQNGKLRESNIRFRDSPITLKVNT